MPEAHTTIPPKLLQKIQTPCCAPKAVSSCSSCSSSFPSGFQPPLPAPAAHGPITLCCPYPIHLFIFRSICNYPHQLSSALPQFLSMFVCVRLFTSSVHLFPFSPTYPSNTEKKNNCQQVIKNAFNGPAPSIPLRPFLRNIR